MSIMPEYSEGYIGDDRIFDDSFEAVSFNADESERLQAIGITLERNGRRYSLEIETYGIHMARLEASAEESETEGDPTLVMPGEEILPSDLVSIKQASFEDLEPFLVLQEPEQD